jgi:hypothetical protein
MLILGSQLKERDREIGAQVQLGVWSFESSTN